LLDYSKYSTTPAIPEAGSMIETFRAIGYSIETAVADIVDNSISAGAKSVWINFEWLGNNTWLSVKDDGCGMNNDELVQAMRPGSKNPLEERGSKDLGRFGLGLKTASFSQCRRLSVISKRDNLESVFWTWDLDFVKKTGKWNLLKYLPDGNFENEVNSLKSGTIIIWNNIDRLVKDFQKDDDNALDKFLQTMIHVKNHLAMVFHRFIENGKIKILFQDRLVEAWNPFLPHEPTTQGFPEEPLYNGNVVVKGFVLPHKSKLTDDKFRAAEGPRGWNEQQGFYIYRNERLLLSGDWLGMFRKEEHYKLARIEINLPNSLDSVWQIDIKKSIARPPLPLRDQLKAYASKVRTQAVEVYRHRGKIAKPYPGQKFIPLWIDHKRGDKWFYVINRKHPLIEKIISQAYEKPVKAIETLLRFIEETIPVKSIYIREAEEPEGQGKPFEGKKHDEIYSLMKSIFDSLLSQGKTIEEAKAVIINLEPFNLYPEEISRFENK
jgi:hypothetical protein